MEPFDPERLTPNASLNRVVINDLPGVALEPGVKGKRAYDLLAAGSIATAIHENTSSLGIHGAQEMTDGALLRRFDHCFIADDPSVRATAEGIARRFGRSLAYVILTLKRGDPVNRQERPDWDDSVWDFWTSRHRIRLGGGVLAGRLGPNLCDVARQTLHEHDMGGLALHLAEYPSLLPLIGVARRLPCENGKGLVFDFGGSLVKRGVASFADGRLVALRTLTPVPAPAIILEPGDAYTIEQAQTIGEAMVQVMADTCQSIRDDEVLLAPTFGVSVAAYVRDGRVLPRQFGTYATLYALPERTDMWLAQQVGARLENKYRIDLIHDGTAAAQVYVGTPQSAVIMLGTALGVGFPPTNAQLRPINLTHVINPY